MLDADPRRIKKVRIHRNKNRAVERDRDGRRRYSTPETASPAIAPAPPPDAAVAEPKPPQANPRPKAPDQP